MAKVGQRIAAITLAVLFLITSIGFSGLVIWEMQKQNKNQKTTETKNDTNNVKKEGKMEGTKLKDYQPVSSITELQKIDTVVGTGAEVKPNDTVTAHYIGALAKDGTIFDTSFDRGQPATFPLSGVIKGWQEGVPGMKVGGKRRLLIPASLGYGAQGSPPKIGPNEPLVFDIELVKIGE